MILMNSKSSVSVSSLCSSFTVAQIVGLNYGISFENMMSINLIYAEERWNGTNLRSGYTIIQPLSLKLLSIMPWSFKF